MNASERLTIWTNFKLPQHLMERLTREVHPHQLLLATSSSTSNLADGAADPLLAKSDIAFGQPDPQQVIALPNLRWIHLNTAGYTRYDRDDLRAAVRARGAVLTNASWVFAEPCAEHVMAMMLALSRQLPAALDNQRGDRGWPIGKLRATSPLLVGQTVLLVGFGTIARRLTELLAAFKVKLIGVRRSPSGDEPVKVLPIEKIEELLPQADHVVNILPASESTRNFFGAARFSKMKATAIFYNIGRGDTVDQAALRLALLKKQIAAAYLDVTTPEPLPSDDPLWETANCYITPHTGGGHTTEFERQVEHFIANLRRFERGDELADRVV